MKENAIFLFTAMIFVGDYLDVVEFQIYLRCFLCIFWWFSFSGKWKITVPLALINHASFVVVVAH